MHRKKECLLFTLHRTRYAPRWCGHVLFYQIGDDRLWARLWSVSPIWVSYIVIEWCRESKMSHVVLYVRWKQASCVSHSLDHALTMDPPTWAWGHSWFWLQLCKRRDQGGQVGRWLGALEARVLVNDLGLGWSGDGGYLYAGAAAY
jgi:hypothetical protein